MRLSEKGESRLYNSKNVFYDDDIEGDVVALWELSKVWEFEPDDFKDCVVLTIEEAKGLLEIARDYRMYLFEHCRIPLSLSSNEAFTALRERIEQAEKKK